MSSEKILAFLERHVQWFVLGIAALYVGYMGYYYIYTAPSTLTLTRGAPLRPDQIDPTILKTQIEPLDEQIKDTKVNSPPLTDVRELFKKLLDEKGVQLADLTYSVTGSHMAPGSTKGGPQLVENKVIDHLFVPPPAIVKDVVARRTVAMVGGKRQDVNYATVRVTINSSALAAAVNDVLARNSAVPQNLFQTLFASVELLRQEKKPDGSWSEPVVVKPLSINAVQPLPGPKATPDQVFAFKAWMEASQPLLTNPPFYQTASDAEPHLQPGAAVPTVNPVAPAVPGNPAAPPPVRVPPRRPGAKPTAAAAAPAPVPDVVAAAPAPAAPAVDPAAATGAGGNGMNPNGNPNLLPGDIVLIAHDGAVEENKTYRYAVRYQLYNPLHGSRGLANDAISAQLTIPGPDPMVDAKNPAPTQWTADVSVEPSTYVFLSHTSLFNSQAEFFVFHWKDGHWTKGPTTGKKMTPGDSISDPKDVSNWTLVDVRKDPRPGGSNYAILMDADGTLKQRDEKTDLADPKLAQLTAQAVAAPAAPAPVAAK